MSGAHAPESQPLLRPRHSQNPLCDEGLREGLLAWGPLGASHGVTGKAELPAPLQKMGVNSRTTTRRLCNTATFFLGFRSHTLSLHP